MKGIKETMNESDFLFYTEQKVRILKNVINDGQTPKNFSGAIGKITRRYFAGIIIKDAWYEVEVDGHTEPFREYELDHRYCKDKKPLTKKEVKRLIKKFEKIEHKFAIIDEQIDRSMQVSQKMLDTMIDI